MCIIEYTLSNAMLKLIKLICNSIIILLFIKIIKLKFNIQGNISIIIFCKIIDFTLNEDLKKNYGRRS